MVGAHDLERSRPLRVHQALDEEDGVAEQDAEHLGHVLVCQPRLHELVGVAEVDVQPLLEELQQRVAVEVALGQLRPHVARQVVSRQREDLVAEGAHAPDDNDLGVLVDPEQRPARRWGAAPR